MTQRYFEVYTASGFSATVVGEDRAQHMVVQLYHSGRHERPDYMEITAEEFRRRAFVTMKAAGVFK